MIIYPYLNMYKNNNKKIVATIEARMSASRLPGKVLMPLAGKPALERLVERMKRSRYIDEIVVATTVNPADKSIAELADGLGIKFYRGSENDVLGRVLEAAKSAGGDIIVEITGDCPLTDWRLIDRGIEEFFSGDYDYAANTIERSYPDGFDVEVFPVSVLERVGGITNNPIDRVHVSYYIYNHPEIFRLLDWKPEKECYWPDLRVTLDERSDYELLNEIFKKLLPANEDFSVRDVVDLLRNNPQMLEINKNVKTKKPEEG